MLDLDNWPSLIVRWLLLAAAVWVAAWLVGGIHLTGLKSTLIVAAILGLFNLYLRPILVVLSCPLTILTLGLFIFVLNAILLGLTDWVAGQIGGIDFQVDNFWAALLGAIVISIVSTLLNWIVRPDRLDSGRAW